MVTSANNLRFSRSRFEVFLLGTSDYPTTTKAHSNGCEQAKSRTIWYDRRPHK
ncbi:hypothetical protein PAXRUDRAFT_834478 [Paxillus rubicundulus Ve08.2h10]|uniref:Uncharacterized protein n=1 Tax=Paxillus rubicundulus Ve08.2h10 TaxID=930991 RepID=A0A0D0D512_9AGAM|nr:hypothetical protein PAXRUDRAFT_834478 [Paxillus rubicundulus Ve08.2h10]